MFQQLIRQCRGMRMGDLRWAAQPQGQGQEGRVRVLHLGRKWTGEGGKGRDERRRAEADCSEED